MKKERPLYAWGRQMDIVFKVTCNHHRFYVINSTTNPSVEWMGIYIYAYVCVRMGYNNDIYT